MSFDPDSFLSSTTTESNDTKLVPVPEGEFVGIIEDVKARPWAKKDDPSVAGIALDVIWLIDDADVKSQLGRDKVTCKQGIMLELNENGKLDTGKGKNVGVGRLREATGLNRPGEPFGFPMLVGLAARVKVSHRIAGEDIFAEIKAVTALN